jgi:hypothetical protein
MQRDVRVGPGVMVRVRRTIGGWVFRHRDQTFLCRRTTTASHWRVVEQGTGWSREVCSLRQCVGAALEYAALPCVRPEGQLDKSAAIA